MSVKHFMLGLQRTFSLHYSIVLRENQTLKTVFMVRNYLDIFSQK